MPAAKKQKIAEDSAKKGEIRAADLLKASPKEIVASAKREDWEKLLVFAARLTSRVNKLKEAERQALLRVCQICSGQGEVLRCSCESSIICVECFQRIARGKTHPVSSDDDEDDDDEGEEEDETNVFESVETAIEGRCENCDELCCEDCTQTTECGSELQFCNRCNVTDVCVDCDFCAGDWR